MTLNELHQLVAKGESDTLEFKKSTAELDTAFETICGFLNHKGGTVLIGVGNNGTIIGQDVSDNTQKKIATCVKNIDPPAYMYVDTKYIKLENNKTVIAITAKNNGYSPYTYEAKPYIRNQTTTLPMPQHHYQELMIRRSQLNHSWEDFAADGYTIDSLDHEEIYRTVMDGIAEKRIPASVAKESVEKILRQLDLLTKDGKVKQAAVVLFAKEITSPYNQCWLKMARFQGRDKGGNFIDNQQEHCNAFRVLTAADNFFRKHLPMASTFNPDQFKRIDKLALPVPALREALVNALCHKNYADRTGYISIAIFNDAVEIWNNGTLPNGLTLEDLKHQHDSVLRNELIAKIFYLRGYIESWGTGIKKMMDSCKEHKVPAPRFAERTGGIVVRFRFAKPIGESAIKQSSKTELNARQKAVLAIIKKHGSANIKQIMSELDNPPSSRTISSDLVLLKKAGLIELKGSKRGSLWVIK